MSSTELQQNRERLFCLPHIWDNLFRVTSSDPVLEPMLQSVPDPFDAYGPPKSENQIFSILAPLAIFNGSQSTETLALGNPAEPAMAEVDSTDVYAVGTGGSPDHGSVGSWGNEFVEHNMNGGGHQNSDDLARPWGDGKTPTASPPRSIRGVASSSSSTTTVQRSKSPPSSTSTSRKGSFPPSFTTVSGSGVSLSTSTGAASSSQPQSQQRHRSEVKLRNVLSAISEKSGHSQSSSTVSSKSTSHSRSSSSGGASHDREASYDTLRASRLPRDVTEALSEEHEHDSSNETDGWSSDMFHTGGLASVTTGESSVSIPDSAAHTE